MTVERSSNAERTLRHALLRREQARASLRAVNDRRRAGELSDADAASEGLTYAEQMAEAEREILLARDNLRSEAERLKAQAQGLSLVRKRLAARVQRRAITAQQANEHGRRLLEEQRQLERRALYLEKIAAAQSPGDLGDLAEVAPLIAYSQSPVTAGRFWGIEEVSQFALPILIGFSIFLTWLGPGPDTPSASLYAISVNASINIAGPLHFLWLLYLLMPLLCMVYAGLDDHRLAGWALYGTGALCLLAAGAFVLAPLWAPVLLKTTVTSVAIGLRAGAICYIVGAIAIIAMGKRRIALARGGPSHDIVLRLLVLAVALVFCAGALSAWLDPVSGKILLNVSPPSAGSNLATVIIENYAKDRIEVFVPLPADSKEILDGRYGVSLEVRGGGEESFRFFPGEEGTWLQQGRIRYTAEPLSVEPHIPLKLELDTAVVRNAAGDIEDIRVNLVDGAQTIAAREFHLEPPLAPAPVESP